MTRNIFPGFIAVIWSLWLGGLGALFFFVTALFKYHNSVFHEAAPTLFQIFEKYQLFLAGIAMASTLALCIMHGKRTVTAMFILFALAGLGSVVSFGVITPRMETLRLANQTQSAEFKSLHGKSMMVYLGELVVLLPAGWLLTMRSSDPAKP